MQEIWKDIIGYEGLYQVSNLGRVRRLSKIITDVSQGGVRKRLFEGRILSQSFVGCGYKSVMLSMNGCVKRYNVHRLVAQAFIPNLNDLPEINHLDEDKTNNCVDNLEWCTAKYNSNYGDRNKKISFLKRERDKQNRQNKSNCRSLI